MNDEKILLTVADLRRRTGLSRERILELLQRAKVRPFLQGKRVTYYAVAELEERIPRLFRRRVRRATA